MPAPAPAPLSATRSIMDVETAQGLARYLLRELECVELALTFLDGVEKAINDEASAIPRSQRQYLTAKPAW